ncbi:MAG: sulfatase [Thermoanaerobaculia bacterium]
MIRRRSAVSLLAAGVLASCGRVPEPAAPARWASVEIASLSPAAELWTETGAIDIGDPAARALLWRGWGDDEQGELGRFAWGLGEESELFFRAVEPRDRSLRLRGQSFPFPGGEAQRVAVSLNGRPLAAFDLPTSAETVRVDLPAAAQVAGENWLTLAYSRSAGRGRASRPMIDYAVAWDGARFDDGGGEKAPRFDAGAAALELPPRSAAELGAELPAGSRLSWDALAPVATGSGEAELSVAWATPGGEERRSRVRAPGPGALDLDLAGREVRRVALRLAAPAGSRGARVVRPRLEWPAETPVASPTPARPASGATAASSAARAAGPPNVVVYLVDTLRADHLGCYGYARPTSPRVDAFAREAALFTGARAQSSWTRPTVASIVTGLYPPTHGAMDRANRIPDAATTLAERLRALGYATAFVTTNANTSARFGFAQGVDDFRYMQERRNSAGFHVASAKVTEWALPWLERRDRERPFLLFLHTTDPHAPYLPPEEFRRRLAADVADPDLGLRRTLAKLQSGKLPAAELLPQEIHLYDAEIAANDDSFGELLDFLARQGLLDDSIVVFVADHGEEFLEHGKVEHGKTLYEEQLRVPLLVRLPRGESGGRRIDGTAEQVDLVPTILEAIGAPADPALPGRSLLPSIRGRAELGRHPSFAWLDRLSYAFAAVEASGSKLIRATDGDRPSWRDPLELYELIADPGERTNRVRLDRVTRVFLESQLRLATARAKPTFAPQDAPLDAETEKALRALGYIR